MRKRLITTLALAAFALTSLAFFRPPPAEKQSAADLAKMLTRLDEEWSKTVATKDADKVAAFYATDGVAYPHNQPVARGRDGARATWAAYFADPSFVSVSWKPSHAEVAASGDLGFTVGAYEYNFKGPDGKPAKEIGKYLCVWKKQADGAWKAAHDMWNADAK